MEYRVERSTNILVDSQTLAPLILNLENWPHWSPWLCLEPGVTSSFSDDGSTMSWQGERIGEGRLIKAQQTDNSLDVDLEFIKPFKSKAKARLHWHTQAGITMVTWTMLGNLPWFMFFLKGMMKGWVAMDYRRGLIRLKALAETGTIPATLHLDEQPARHAAFQFIGLLRKGISIDEMDVVMQQAFDKVLNHFDATSDCHYICFVDKTSISAGTFDLAIGAAFENILPEELPDGENWEVRNIAAHQALTCRLDGPYHFLGDAWSMAMMALRPLGFKSSKRIAAYEKYLNGPFNTEKPEDFVTEVITPLR